MLHWQEEIVHVKYGNLVSDGLQDSNEDTIRFLIACELRHSQQRQRHSSRKRENQAGYGPCLLEMYRLNILVVKRTPF